MQRIPIIKRSAIYQRTPICPKVEYNCCKLCNNCINCNGKQLNVFYANTNEYDFNTLINDIWECEDTKKNVRLVIDVPIPKEVVWATSFSEKNILQINVNMLDFKTPNSYQWLGETMNIANRCGLFCILLLYPIVPTITRTYEVIRLIDMVRYFGKFHTYLKFLESNNIIHYGNWLNFNNTPIAASNFVYEEPYWKCSDDFKKKFLDIVMLYTKPYKLPISICGKTNC